MERNPNSAPIKFCHCGQIHRGDRGRSSICITSSSESGFCPLSIATMPTQKPRATNQQTYAQSYESYEPDSLASAENVEPSDRQLDQPRRRRRRRYPTVKRPAANPDLFPDGEINRMTSNRVIWEECNILTQGENLGWFQSGEKSPYYESPVAKGKGYISFWVTNDLHAKPPAVLEGETALALIEQFDIRAACMHLIYAAYATQLERSWEQSFVLSDTQLKRYLGLDEKTYSSLLLITTSEIPLCCRSGLPVGGLEFEPRPCHIQLSSCSIVSLGT